jgi:hypothetical protein
MFGERLISVSIDHQRIRLATYLCLVESLAPSQSLPLFALHLVDECDLAARAYRVVVKARFELKPCFSATCGLSSTRGGALVASALRSRQTRMPH